MNLQDITDRIIRVAESTAHFISEERKTFDPAHVEQKGENDLVSYVDKTAEKMLVENLREILPQAGFITEEATVEQSHESLHWIIDPLDGTTNFVHGIPIYAVSIALADGDEMLAGVVHEVNSSETFHAFQGGGAFLNGEKIHVSTVKRLNDGLFLTGLPVKSFAQKEPYLQIVSELMEKTHGLRRMGSAAVDLAYVACGRAEGYFECNLHIWDIAAGVLLVQEAGGKVTNFKGSDGYLSTGEILASGAVHGQIVDIIQKYWT